MGTTTLILLVALALFHLHTTTAQTEVILRYCKWEKSTAQHGLGATMFAQVTSLDDCLDRCLKRPTCVGVDYDLSTANQKQCWYHDTAGYSISAQPNTDNYKLVGCDAVVANCLSMTWDSKGNIGPTDLASSTHTLVTGSSDCRTKCQNNPLCRAVSFPNPNPNSQCYLYLAEGLYEANTQTRSGYVTDVLTNRCPTAECPTNTYGPQWTSHENQGSSPGAPSSSSRTKEDCRTECLYNPSCIGFDYLPDASATETFCYMFTTQSALDNVRFVWGSQAQVNQERLDRCPTSAPSTATCYDIWTETQNLHGSPSLPFPLITSKADCLSACVATSYCQGVDVDLSTSPPSLCWMYKSAADFTANEQFKAQVLHIKLDDRCQTTPPEVTDPPACRDPIWDTPDVGHGRWRGERLPHVTSSDECRSACVSDSECKGVDYDEPASVGYKCYILYKIEGTYTKEGVTHYGLVDPCPLTDYKCVDATWVDYPNFRAIGGDPAPQFTTSETCKLECVKRARDSDGCEQIDFDPTADTKCYLFTTKVERQAATGITSSELEEKCVTEAPDGATTTTVAPPESCHAGVMPQWTFTADMAASGGNQRSNIFTKIACLDECESTSQCVAVDMKDNFACFVHTSPADAVRSTGVERAELIRCPTRSESYSGACKGEYTYPASCMQNGNYDGCEYVAKWLYREDSDDIMFTVITDLTNTDAHTDWMGIGFSATQSMVNSDVYLAYQRDGRSPEFFDGYIGGSRAPPQTVGDTNNIEFKAYNVVNGRGTFEFVRQRDTGASSTVDMTFTDDASGCFYFLYPVTGGDTTSSGLGKHRTTPTMSAEKICIKACDDCDYFAYKYRYGTSGGTPKASLTTQKACEDGCFASSSCLGVDFVPSKVGQGDYCFHVESQTVLDSLSDRGTDDIVHGKLERCQDAGTETITFNKCEFTKHTGKSSSGASPVTGTTSRDQCLQACIDDQPNCKAVEYSDQFGCYMHTSDAFKTEMGDNDNGVDLYEWRDNCEGVSSTTTASTTTTSASTTSTVSPTTTVVHDDCTFNVYADEGANGASEVVGANTAAECLQACEDNRVTCKAVEYSDGLNPYNCYMHNNENYKGLQTARQGVTLYELSSCDAPPTGCSEDKVAWTYYIGASVSGGQAQGQLDSDDACKKVCFDMGETQCKSVDMKLETNGKVSCWTLNKLSTDAGEVRRSEDSSVIHADMTSRCPGDCTAQYSRYEQTKMSNGQDRTGDLAVDSEVGCSDVCRSLGSSCSAAEWRPADTSKCWIYDSSVLVTRGNFIDDAQATLLVPLDC